MEMNDSDFLKDLNITNWPDADSYKETPMTEPTFNAQDVFGPDLDYFDEVPEDSPFSDAQSQLEAEAQEEDGLAEIKIQLAALILEFLELSSEDELNNFLDNL
jgi:hypothetical protein